MTGASASRLSGFDYLRCAAALAVVVLHASAPYMPHRMPGLTWPVFDTTSPTADWIGWSIELWIMPLFLMMAGYFAAPMLNRQTAMEFVRSRAVRLLIPLCFGILVILPLDFYTWMLGWYLEGRVELRKIRSLKFSPETAQDLWGLSHLWFLHYLFFYSVAWVVARRLGLRARPDASLALVALQGIGLVAVGVVTLAIVPKVVFGFQHAFLPVPSKWIYSGTYFAGGLLLAGYPRLMSQIQRHTVWLLILGFTATMLGVALGQRWLENLALHTEPLSNLRWTLAAVTTIAAWSVSLGLHGWASASTWPSRNSVRYFAAATLWIYMFHHPVVAFAHIPLKFLAPAWPVEVKLVLAAALGIAASLITFELFFRRQPLARWFGTPESLWKIRRGAVDSEDESAAATDSYRA